MDNCIHIQGAREHNLKNLSLEIPKNQLVVLTGISGSGKSTLAFDILYKESMRQYMESMGMVTDFTSKARVDSIQGLSPSISIDQHLSNHNPRSTVGTMTEVYTYLRVLFARLGNRPCPKCRKMVLPPQELEDLSAWDQAAESETPGKTFPCPHCGQPMPEIGMAAFSFNKPEGACPTCTGLGEVNQVDVSQLIDEEKSILEGAVRIWAKFNNEWNAPVLQRAAKYYGFEFDPKLAIKKYTPQQRDLLLYGVESREFQKHGFKQKPPKATSAGRFEGVVTNLLRRYSEGVHKPKYKELLEKYMKTDTCPDCQGMRLKLESREVQLSNKTIIEAAQMPLSALANWLKTLPQNLQPGAAAILEPILADVNERLRRLCDVGAGYLTLGQSSPSLSAGEAQRLRLAMLLGSGLTGVLYILDEPTIGLHSRDTNTLIKVLKRLRDLGNTVLVIEHDLDMIKAADYVIDIGPGAGKQGGVLVAAGTWQEISENMDSITGAYCSGREKIVISSQRPRKATQAVVIKNARAHNLKNITAAIPLQQLVAITGVSGSGKSSLIFDILDKAGRNYFNHAKEIPGEHAAIKGWQALERIITLDQKAIGRTPRSNAATYTDAYTPIREVFAATPEAKKRKLTATHFSFNVAGGRCERCQGAGVLSVEMHFLPDVEVRCPACHGQRFKSEVLAVTIQGKNIAQVLDMTIDEAYPIFQGQTAVCNRLGVMQAVGLGYLPLGQPATTLSGGEAQRVKLAKELGRGNGGKTLYLLDEPTTGLHPHDTQRLLLVLQQLVEQGNSVVVIEHNLDLIKCADWMIDLGPEGGEAGGRILAEGTPEEVAKISTSHTGRCLQKLFE